VRREVRRGGARLVVHVGDVSYADGKGDVWEAFMKTICKFADSVPYMVAVGNHDYDYKGGKSKHDPSGLQPFRPKWGEFKRDSGGECGVPLTRRFTMPSTGCARALPLRGQRLLSAIVVFSLSLETIVLLCDVRVRNMAESVALHLCLLSKTCRTFVLD
jgi:Calcineurin-like phosphoesterase